MDSKTKHRILGILVVAGLIVLMLPFFQSNHELTGNVATINPPPFPEQSAQATSPNGESQPTAAVQEAKAEPTAMQNSKVDQQPDEAISRTHATAQEMHIPEMAAPRTPSTETKLELRTIPAEKSPQQTAQAKTPTNEISLRDMDEDLTPLSPATIKKQARVAVNLLDGEPHPKNSQAEKSEQLEQMQAQAQARALVKAEAQAQAALEEPIRKVKASVGKSSKMATRKHTTHHKAVLSAVSHSDLDSNGLFKLKNAAYVVQFGSYKSKAKALRVVNQLRAKGYRAFIQQYSTGKGNTIEVYVGPEKKHAAARALASDIENDMNIHGMVISYKPLAL